MLLEMGSTAKPTRLITLLVCIGILGFAAALTGEKLGVRFISAGSYRKLQTRRPDF
jgi:hypothetical protein